MKISSVQFMLSMVLLLGGTVSGLAQDKPGPALVGELCTKCHNLDEVVRLRQDRVGWADTVYSMVGRGAPIYPEEIDSIIDYLSEAYPAED